jgi:hypothetical protein
MQIMKKEIIGSTIGKITITFILPVAYANRLGANDNDLFKCYLDGPRIIIEKINKNEEQVSYSLRGDQLCQ